MLVRTTLVTMAVSLTSAGGDGQHLDGLQAREAGAGPPRYVLSDSPSVTIGARDDPAHQLTLPVGALRLSSGGIVIAESLTRDLRYFDHTGSHLFTVGGRGQGPGEFGSLRSIGRLADGGVWTWDPRERRVQFFDRTGQVTESVSISAWPDIARRLMDGRSRSGVTPYNVYALHDGTGIVRPLIQPMLTASGVVRDTVPLIMVEPDGVSWSEVRPIPVMDDWLVHEGLAGMLPFGDRVHVAAGRDAVYITSRHGGVIAKVVPGQRVLDTIAPGIARRPLSGSDARAMRDAMTSRSEGYADAIPMPDSMPALSDIKVGSSGRLWVKEYVGPTDAQQRWVAVEETGEVVASVTMDVELEVMDLGMDYALVQIRDLFDVPTIRMHGLIPAR